MAAQVITKTTLFRKTWRVVLSYFNEAKTSVVNLDVKALDIDFDVVRSHHSTSTSPTPNKGKIVFYNLTQDHQAEVLRRENPEIPSQTTGVRISLEAGYNDNNALIFSGDSRLGNSSKDVVDWKTEIVADDGGRAWRESRISASYAAGTTIGTILKDVATALNIGIGNIDKFTNGAEIVELGKKLSAPMTLHGTAVNELNRVINGMNLTWSIQNGLLQILPKGKPISTTAIHLSPSTGLLGSPGPAVNASVSLGNPQQYKKGATAKAPKPKPKDPSIIRFQTLIIPGMVPGRRVLLDSEFYKGDYTLMEVQYLGKSWAKDWYCNCIARKSVA